MIQKWEHFQEGVGVTQWLTVPVFLAEDFVSTPIKLLTFSSRTPREALLRLPQNPCMNQLSIHTDRQANSHIQKKK